MPVKRQGRRVSNGTSAVDAVAEPVERGWPSPAWLLLALLGALALRLVFQAGLARSPFATSLFLDAAQYDEWAKDLASGHWIGEPRPYFVDPGYAFFLAVLRIIGLGLGGVRAVQVIAGLGTVALTAALGQKLGGRRGALLAALVAATYLPLVYFEGMILKTTLEVFLGTAILYTTVVADESERGPTAWGGIGLLTGLAVLFKSNYLLLALLVPAWRLISTKRQDLRRTAWTCASFALGVTLVLAPIAARNRLASGESVLVTYGSGFNFYIGNGSEADGSRRVPPFVRPTPGAEEMDSYAEASRRAGRELSWSESSDAWWAESVRAIAADPARWLGLMVVKTRMFLNRFEVTDNVSMDFVARWTPLLRAPLPGWWLVAPLGLAGCVWALRSGRRHAMLLFAYVATQSLGVIAFHVADRYRLAVVPALIVLAAGGLAGWPMFTTRRRLELVAAALVGVVVVDALPNPAYSSGQSLANHYEMLGVASARNGDTHVAVTLFRQAIALEPGRGTAHHNLASALLTSGGDRAEARNELRAALALRPSYGEASLLLAQTMFDDGDFAEAAHWFEHAADQGVEPVPSLSTAAAALGRIGRLDQAEVLVRRALSLAPGDAHSLETLGNVLVSRGDTAGALEAWRASLTAKPKPELAAALEQLERRAASGP